jgi:pimeloyl-ACP methyl ester carboxylesterase
MSPSRLAWRTGSIVAVVLLFGPIALAQQPKTKGAAGKGVFTQGVTAPSRVLSRGDVEIVTFETEEDYDRLQERYRSTQETQPEPGTMTALYLRSRTDSSVQPYAIRLPREFSRDRSYPVVIQLHGLNFMEVLSGSRVRYQGMGGPVWIEGDLKVIYVQCFGRPSTFYRGMGEEDVLEVLDEVKRRFPVDADRVYVMGHSMGGSGSYTIGLHYPDLFGGIMPIDAAMGSMLAGGGAGGAGQNRPAPPSWMEPQIAIHTPAKLYPNARNVDVFFKNAGAGIQRRSTEFTDGIVAEGGFSTAESFPGMPHNFGDSYAYAHFVTELIQHPIKRRPAEVKLYTNTLRYNRAYWVTVDRLTRHNADASVVATCDESSGIRIKTQNIDALTLRLDDAPAPKGAALLVDDTTVVPSSSGGVLSLSKQGGTWKAGPWTSPDLTKRHGLQGPIDDAFNSRFLAVYGDGDRDLAIAELDALRNPPTVLDIHGDFPMKPAAQVTAQDVESSNLILFGTPQSNAVLRRIAGALPPDLLKPGDDGAQAVFVYPNPESPSRYVVVWPAKVLSTAGDRLRSSWIMPIGLLPDYLKVKDGQIIAGGHFDSDWKLGAE